MMPLADAPTLLAVSVLAPIMILVVLPMVSRQIGLGIMAIGPLPALMTALILPTGTILEVPWLLLGAQLALDQIGSIFLLLTSLLWLTASIYANGAFGNDPNARRFAACFLLAMSGNIGVIIADDIVSFYTAFALMSLASFGLVVHRDDTDARYAGRIYLALVVVGEVALFIGMALSAGVTGSIALPGKIGIDLGWVATSLLVIGFGLKAGMIPLHVWLPLAHPAAPIAASAVLSGAMIKTGLLGLIRFLPVGIIALPTLGEILLIAGLGATFFGVIVGLTQMNPKTVLAYSSISQVGLMLMALGLVAVAPDAVSTGLLMIALIAFHHGLAKGALFFACGFKMVPCGRTGRICLGLAMLAPALALAGAPFTSGSTAKAVLGELTVAASEPLATWLPVLLPASATGTALLMGRFLILTWPRHDSTMSVSPFTYVAFGASVAISILAIWWLPEAIPFTSATFDVDKLASGLLPLVIATAITTLIVVWRVRLATGVPAGDVLALLEASAYTVSAYRFRLRAKTALDDVLNGFHKSVRAIGVRLFQALDSLEVRFRAFSVAGTCLIVLILVSFAIGLDSDRYHRAPATSVETPAEASQD